MPKPPQELSYQSFPLLRKSGVRVLYKNSFDPIVYEADSTRIDSTAYLHFGQKEMPQEYAEDFFQLKKHTDLARVIDYIEWQDFRYVYMVKGLHSMRIAVIDKRTDEIIFAQKQNMAIHGLPINDGSDLNFTPMAQSDSGCAYQIVSPAAMSGSTIRFINSRLPEGKTPIDEDSNQVLIIAKKKTD